jgi:hypothetical protein
MKKTAIAAALIAGLGLSMPSFAAPAHSSVGNGANSSPVLPLAPNSSDAVIFNRANSLQGRFLDGSETATFFFRKGVRAFDAGELDKAEEAFRASLRADGLDRLSLHYLVIINDRQGDEGSARDYADRYFALAG